MVDESLILAFYRRESPQQKYELPCPLTNFTLMNKNPGLGDTVIITDLPRIAAKHGRKEYIYSGSRFFYQLTTFNPYYEPGFAPFFADADLLNSVYSLGNGHFIQRLQRAYGFEPELRPSGCVHVENAVNRGRAVFHFEPGRSARDQKHIHPLPRQIYKENMRLLQRLVHDRRDMEFFEVGSHFSGLDSVGDWTGLPLEQTIRKMASCEYFIGIMSGPLHLAIALGLKVINIINFPAPSRIYLPVLKDIDLVETEWLYPQSVLLHQDGEGELVARFSLANLERAINGDLYPYWSDRYLSLIHEKI
jgi:hypothetical protein